MSVITHPQEPESNAVRAATALLEPKSLRTYTPSQAVLAHSAGCYHWTPEGKRLYDYSSGVLVANLGHNPIRWTQRFAKYMGWPTDLTFTDPPIDVPEGYFPAVTMTAYNGITPIEIEASRRLLQAIRECPGSARLDQVMWAASGSEAVQKALWAAMARDRSRPMILATRFGFHGKKGLAGAVTGSEHDHERDPRVKFVGFPMHECDDVSRREAVLDLTPFKRELEETFNQYGRRFGVLITEPYLGGGGSYHPQKAYLHLLQSFCRENDILFILDEVQANFGRTGCLFAFETYGLEPDMVVLGKGLGNGVPVAAVVGRKDVFGVMEYGDASDTWSANPLCCASVLATLDEFAEQNVIATMHEASAIIEQGLVALKRLPFVAKVRGEKGGMVWGVEFAEFAGRSAPEWANAAILACYRGESPESDGIHLLGALAKKVVRISPPCNITPLEARESIELMDRLIGRLAIDSARSHTPAMAGMV